MDSDSWAQVASCYRRHLSRSDVYNGEGCEAEEELNPEYLCPFCAEHFDMVGLCCHIDEMHPVPAKNGMCPVCSRNVGRRVLRRGGSNSPFSILRRELRDENLQSLYRGSSLSGSLAHTEPDPVLSSFIVRQPVFNKSSSIPPFSSVVPGPTAELSAQNVEDRSFQLSEEDLKEKAQKCEFVRGLLVSTFLDDNL
ncbi:hypothetical protein CASFOL_030115 [Castilleja foliolosa]|uniref:Uncharacterized protein n=1 Tax=Castilleja foliolosa TaxID=1961234 RepID=A0ABD3CB54_9LAMI